MADTNYSSGDDYIVEFLGYRFTFNACDFEQRVVAAAAKLGLVEANELDEDETNDLVALAAQGVIDEPESRLGRYLQRNWERVSLLERRVARLLAPEARLPRRLARPPGEARRARGRLGRDARPSSPTSTPAAGGPCSSSPRCRAGTTSSSGLTRLLRHRRRRARDAEPWHSAPAVKPGRPLEPPPPPGAPVRLATVSRCPGAGGFLIAYLAALLALDHFADYPEQLALGALTWAVLIAACLPLPTIHGRR